MPTVVQILGISKVSQFLSTTAILRGNLYGKGLDLNLPRKLYCIRQNVQYRYDQEDIAGGETPSAALISVANKLYSLCYAVGQATNIFNGGTGGGSVTPVSPSQPIFPFWIFSADFESDGVTILDTRFEGANVALFINEFSQQWLGAGLGYFVYVDGGIEITIPGFDANTQDYTIMVQQVFGNGVTPPAENDLLINDTDSLLINSIDSLLIS